MEHKEDRPGGLTIAVIVIVALSIPALIFSFLVFGLQPALAPSSSTTPQSATTVKIPDGVGANQSLNYQPASITVVVGVNNTIKWVQEDPIPHTVTSTSVPTGASTFDSKTLNKGDSFVLVLSAPGTYHYQCTFHPGWMQGTIVVVGPGPAQGSTVSTGALSGSVVNVSIPTGVGSNPNLNFNPSTITVVVGTNNTVRWTDNDPTPHTVTSTSVPSGAKSFDSGNLIQGDVFTVTLSVPGTYDYICSYHSGWMKGTILVRAAATG